MSYEYRATEEMRQRSMSDDSYCDPIADGMLQWLLGVDMRLVSNVDKSMLSVRARKVLIRLSWGCPELKVSDVKEETLRGLTNCGVVTVIELMDWKEMKHKGLKHGMYDMSGNG